MLIFESHAINGIKIIYNFEIKEKEVSIFSTKHKTTKWLSLENWSEIYCKLNVISENLIKKFHDDCSHTNHLKEILMDNICMEIETVVLGKEVKKILNVKHYELPFYLRIKIEYRLPNEKLLLNGIKEEIVEEKPKSSSSRAFKKEYSPSAVDPVNHYIPKPTTKEVSEILGTKNIVYKPSPQIKPKKIDCDEYVPEATEKLATISYTPTKISDTKITAATISPDKNFNIKNTRMCKTTVNYSELPRKRHHSGSNGKEKHKDEKRKHKMARLFDDVEDENAADDYIVGKVTSTNNKVKKSSKEKHDKKSRREHSQSKDQNSIKDFFKSSTSSNLQNILCTTLPPNELNCYEVSLPEIEKSFKEVKKKLDKLVQDFRNTKTVKPICPDHLVVHELFTEDQTFFMYNYLHEYYLPSDESGANYKNLMSYQLLPTWGLLIYSKLHNIPESKLFLEKEEET